jgi:hypothetical protein
LYDVDVVFPPAAQAIQVHWLAAAANQDSSTLQITGKLSIDKLIANYQHVLVCLQQTSDSPRVTLAKRQ